MKNTKLRDAIRRALFAGAALAIAVPLHAQEATPAGDAAATPAPAAATTAATAPATLDKVTITGSRISRAVDLETVQPVDVITREERSGFQSVADLLQASTVMGSPAISRADALASGEAVGGSYVDIRNLGAARTLVLVNGQRLGVTSGGLADVSQLPTSAVERIEVLKDGASAIYGSDAIAGVVNIITRKNVDGGEANIYLGQFDEGDGQKQQYDFTFDMTGDTGWLTASLQYAKEDPVWAIDRPFSASGNGPLHPLDGRSGISHKGVLLVPNADPTRPALRYTLRDGGDPRNFADYRPYNPTTDNTNANEQMTLQTGQERRAFYLNAGRDFTDTLTLTVDALYNQRDTMQQIAGYPFRSGNDTSPLWGDWDPRIAPDSYYNPLPGQTVEYYRRTWEVPRHRQPGHDLSPGREAQWRARLRPHVGLGRGLLPEPVPHGEGRHGQPVAAGRAGGGGRVVVQPGNQPRGMRQRDQPHCLRLQLRCRRMHSLEPARTCRQQRAGFARRSRAAEVPVPGHDVGETETKAYFANVTGVLAEDAAGNPQAGGVYGPGHPRAGQPRGNLYGTATDWQEPRWVRLMVQYTF